MATVPATPPTGLKFLSLSASGIVKTGPGTLFMVKCSSGSSGTIKLWDNTAASGTVIQNTMAIDAKEEHYFPCEFATGLYVTIGGTADITAYFI